MATIVSSSPLYTKLKECGEHERYSIISLESPLISDNAQVRSGYIDFLAALSSRTLSPQNRSVKFSYVCKIEGVW